MNNISQMNFIDIGISSLISNSGPEKHPGQNGESFESSSEVPKLVEEKRDGREYKYLERVLESVAAEVDSLECWEDSIEDVLQVGIEGGSDGW